MNITNTFLGLNEVVRAYVLLLDRAVSGCVYNVCTVRSTELTYVVRLVGQAVSWDLPVEQDASLTRPGDNPVRVGDGSKLADFGLQPHVPHEQAVRDQEATWRERLTTFAGELAA